MTRYKVIISDYDFGNIDLETEVIKRQLGDGAEVIGLNAENEAEFLAQAKDADAIITQYFNVNGTMIEQLETCKIIARYGTGVDIVDVKTATKQGILVTNVPDYCHHEVADHAVTLLLSLVRKIKMYDQAVRASEWRWQSGQFIHRIQQKKLGLVGFGLIAKAIAARVKGFGMETMAYTPHLTQEAAAQYGVQAVSFEQLLTTSDYIIVQAPLTDETWHMFSDREFAMMKQGVIFINTARGPIVDQSALIQALETGKVGGAGLDDIEEEPAKLHDWQADSQLFAFDNVIITPHAAYYSEESIAESRRRAAEEVARVLAGFPPKHPVNQPVAAI
ncbi:C-terminal binding protein [Aneurinibacillus tyrosinisolvens]|uniref:C-terminal binding protein n=1 Tax=Aneurinibacillus tyrosinisolvens TaxID=1443435 RepID=UPI00063F8B87|nr:C-terminal binding protein [Aneurinibacillus tyrosinisolvens]